jgi:hypothetical protein
MVKDFDAEMAADADEIEFKLGGEESRPTDTLEQSLEVMDDMILTFLDPAEDAHERYRALRSRDEDAVPIAELEQVSRWLVAACSGRPTGPPSPSSPGRGRNGTTSTDASSARAAAALSL